MVIGAHLHPALILANRTRWWLRRVVVFKMCVIDWRVITAKVTKISPERVHSRKKPLPMFELSFGRAW